MKLHLPDKLRAAVLTALPALACLAPTTASGVMIWFLASLAAPSVQASSLTSNSTEYNNATYSGTILTYDAAGKSDWQTFHSATLTYENAEDQTVEFNCATRQTLDGVTSSNGWRVFASNQTSSYGQTLRLTGATEDVSLDIQFAPFTLGGLITDAGNCTYTLSRDTGSVGVEFWANADVGFNMDIGANTDVTSKGSGFGVTVRTGGTWKVASGKTLTLASTNFINIGTDETNVTVNITGEGTVRFNGPTTVNGKIAVASGTSLSIGGAIALTQSIENNGTITFGENASLTLADCSGLEVDGIATYSDAVSGSTLNGYANASYFVVKGSGQVTGLDHVTLGGETHGLTEREGNLILTVVGTGGDYYVNEGTVVYGGTGDYANSAASSATTGIVLNGGSLEMRQNLAEGVGIHLISNGTVTLGEDVSLSSGQIARSGHTLTLSGSGKYTHQTAAAGDFSLNAGYGFSNWTGTVELEAKTSGNMELNTDSATSYEGTMVLNFANSANKHIVVGKNEVTSNSIFGEKTKLVLNTGAANRALVVEYQYAGEDNALTLASLSSGVKSDGTYAVSYIRGDMGSDGYRYIKVLQEEDTTFAGIFYQQSGQASRDVGLIKDGTGNLTLTGASTSGANLKVNGGTLTFTGNGSWAGTINVAKGATLAFNGTSMNIAANQNQDITFAEGSTLEVKGGSLTLNKALSVSKLVLSGGGAVTVAENLTLTGTNTLACDKVTLNADKSITIGEGGSLESDSITYANGATLTRGATAGGLEASGGGYSVAGGDITIGAGNESSDRIISMLIEGGRVVSNVSGTLTFSEAATMDSFVGGKTTIEGNATINGTATFNGASNITGDAVFGGLTTLNADLTVDGDTTLATTAASIAIGEGKIFSTNEGKLKVMGTADSTSITTSADNAGVNASNEAITISNAEVTVNSAEDYTLDAKLSGSTLRNIGTGVASVKVEEGSTNSFSAEEGNVSVSTGAGTTTQVGELTVGADNTASFVTETGAAADVVVSGTADVAGTVSANVTVQGGGDTQAIFTAQEGAKVDGRLTVTATGTLEISSPQAENTPALTVSGTLELQAGSVLDLSDLVTKQETGVRTFDIAEALSFDIHQDTVVLGLDGYSWRLTNSAGGILLGSPDYSGTDTAAPAMFSMRSAARSTMDTLTLTVLGQADAPVTLTATEVISYDPAGNVLDITVAEDLSLLEGRNLAVTVGSTAWDSIVEAMGDVHTEATITLNGLSLDGFGTVSFNGYAGTGEKGEYFVAYIPEPATATLSLLALAALAARRRRK